ncbi:probable serine/threonine-protein kinase PBL25 [Salvia hispanica]|uniref:probable serine/threonine-protein kinase PBL25 n=1 Tax=Salvia hispanica TaxID=49212 RepID=UPI002009B083|nr:probable serine/threonine-protein kinase PBL25 [Salvia hispanica]
MATKNFSDQNKIGSGSNGIVYKGNFGERLVVVKRRTSSSIPKDSMSYEEIATLSHIQHHNIEHLVGYCDEEGEKIVVYDFVKNHTLAYHLQDEHRSKLGWNVRLKILIGVAQGLCHLNSCLPKAFCLHSNLKSSNILLDEYFVAKVANFGSAKRGFLVELYNHCDITTKIDTYSFGIIMLEVLSGRRVIDRSYNLITCIFEKEASDILDPLLRGNISQNSLNICWNVAKICCSEHTLPTLHMSSVVSHLETALFMSKTDSRNVGNMSPKIPLSELKLHDTRLEEGSARPTLIGNHDQAQRGTKRTYQEAHGNTLHTLR